MKKFENKIKVLTESLVLQEQKENEKLFLFEMKKIGIEKLPYSYSALRQFIDAETMSYHYNKHYKGYVEKLNKALLKKKGADLELEEIIKSISKFDKSVRNNAGGAFNHALFWKMLTPKTQKPTGGILEKIKKDFTTYQKFQLKFEEIAKERFGSGWVWLVLTKKNTLKIVSTPNQDNPLMNVVEDGGYPLLGLDLWEHAYYLKYRNKRDEYIKNFWKAVNWEFVNELLDSKLKNKLNETISFRQVLSEGVSEKCSKEMNDSIRFIFNINPKVKTTFRFAIDSILKSVFPDNYYEKDEYKEGEMSGIYDFEGEGRSVINKLNTNYTCFCILLTDVNKVLKSQNKPEINIIGKSPFEQISETKKLIKFLELYKERIFNINSGTFKNIMTTLGLTHDMGGVTEDYTVKIIKKEFGDENVEQIGELGNQEDMIGGVDCKVVVNGETKTLQIKPFSYTKDEKNSIMVFNTGQVKKYTTDWIAFANQKKGVLIFDNKNTKIINGNYVFPSEDLIYELS